MKERNVIVCGDCLEGMKALLDGCIDACVTDPPYGIRFMGRGWDAQVPPVAVWKEVRRVLKPGAHLLCACGTRTQHRMAVNIEDGGFEIRDVICWHYGSGFPKSLDIGKALEKEAGAGSPAREKWSGWGTALKPATEFWTLARKPLGEGTVAANMQAYGTGGLNIDVCRIPSGDAGESTYMVRRWKTGANLNRIGGKRKAAGKGAALFRGRRKAGRFPANVILDRFMAGVMDKQTGLLMSGQPVGKRRATNNVYGQFAPGQDITGYGDAGGGSRFFYVAKASAEERGRGNDHPTVKPLALMHRFGYGTISGLQNLHYFSILFKLGIRHSIC